MPNRILVNTNYTRSINLERDASSENIVKSYLPTTKSLHVLSEIADRFSSEARPRAWSLIGPYGSGKSSFAVFLKHLLENPLSNVSQLSKRVLRKSHPKLASAFEKIKGEGFCTILLTGSPERLSKRVMQAISDGAEEFWKNKKGSKPKLFDKLKSAARSNECSVGEIIYLLQELQKFISSSNGSGLLIVIDELGKFLEYEARHSNTSDVYLLQALAELSGAANKAPLFLLVLLHQSFDQYARGFGDNLKKEWNKIQGRFESVPFLESTEQVIRIIKAALCHDLTGSIQSKINKFSRYAAEELEKLHALPGTMDSKTAAELFEGCYPLHPLSLIILPMLCQKVAQNERTLFSYLGSHESNGFQESLSRLDFYKNEPTWIWPWEIYEYFILNQPAALVDHFTHRRWAEVVTAVERLGDSSIEALHLLKTIGLFNLIGAQGGFKASFDILLLCSNFFTEGTLKRTLKALQSRSIITYRKFSGEFRVWQGSDFDFESSLQNELNQLGQIDLAATLNGRKPVLPIVARRYTITTGTLRYFAPFFVNRQNLTNLATVGNEAKIFFFLSESKNDELEFLSSAKNTNDRNNIYAVYRNGTEIRSVIMEILAIKRVQRNNPELSSDPVAQRELKDRLTSLQNTERELFNSILEDPSKNIWIWKGNQIPINSKRTLQILLSSVMQEVFYETPIIRNELINRDKPSPTAMAGRNKLLVAMIDNEKKENLGIEKYPPEKSMYLSILQAPGIHRNEKGIYQFSEPFDDHQKHFNIWPVWKRINSFFRKSEKEPIPISTLFAELQSPPTGLKQGLIPILFLAAFLEKHEELALYNKGVFCPVMDKEILEGILKDPSSFSIQCFKLIGIRFTLFKKYHEIITGEPGKDQSLLGIIRPLAKFMIKLPDYTRNTKLISLEAQNVRNIFFNSKSPADLLFKDLPKSCGFSQILSNESDINKVDAFSKKFVILLRELKMAYPRLLDKIKELLSAAFSLDRQYSLSEMRINLRGRYFGLHKYTIDVEGLKAFIVRLSDSSGNDIQWLESLSTFLGRKPPERWIDEDIQASEYRLIELCKKLKDLEKLRLAYEENKGLQINNFEAIIIRSVRQGKRDHDAVICIDKKKRDALNKSHIAMHNLLNQLPEDDLKVAVLAELFNEIMDKKDIQNSEDVLQSLKVEK